jgi:hypothetical protein
MVTVMAMATDTAKGIMRDSIEWIWDAIESLCSEVCRQADKRRNDNDLIVKEIV